MPFLNGHLTALIDNGIRRSGPGESYADQADRSWLDYDWQAITKTILVDGRLVNLIDTGGDKPPLMLLHGLGGTWQSWVLNIAELSQAHRVIVPDLPGFGLSDIPTEEITIPLYAEFLDHLCERLGLETAAIVGNSMGGQIAAEFAIEYPERVSSLGLIAAAGLSNDTEPKTPLIALLQMWIATSSWFVGRSQVVATRPKLRRASFQMTVRYPERVSSALAYELLQGVTKPGIVPGFHAIFSFSFRNRLSEISCPVCIVWGTNDMQLPVGDADLFSELIGGNAETHIFDDTGHCVMLERPERFNALIEGFLERVEQS